MKKKYLDYIMSVRLEDLASKLSNDADIRGAMSEAEYQNALVALRYAASVLCGRA